MEKSLILLITVALLSIQVVMAKTSPALINKEIHLKQGLIMGNSRDNNGVLSYKGIPYAKAPIGDLRWKTPQKMKAWTGTLDATQFGNSCISSLEDDPMKVTTKSEDCLNLNVWTPAKSSDEKLPVMVWIHGGGFQFGSSSEKSMDGTKLAEKGVVIVTFNYRLGVLGFLAHPELDKEGPSGNYGLQDQIAALKWVKENIADFGGDPNNVTIFGESAGAMSEGILTVSPLAEGLFHKVIAQSGAFWDNKNGPLESFEEAHTRGITYMNKMGAKSIKELRAMSAEDLAQASLWNFSRSPITTAFSPNVDRYVLPDFPAHLYAQNKQMKVPLLAGWTSAEYYPFTAFSLPHDTPEEFKAAATRMFGKEKIDEFLKLYPASNTEQTKESAYSFVSDFAISEQTWYWLEMQHRSGNVPVYGYEFGYTSPYLPIASHISDVTFVFGTLTPQVIIHSNTPPSETDYKMSDLIMTYWTNFAKTSNPNGSGLPYWPSYDEKKNIQYLNNQVEGKPIDELQLKRFHFLSGFRTEGIFPMRWRTDVN